jgi:hypothetical protein
MSGLQVKSRTNREITLQEDNIRKFKESLRGELILSEDAGYDDARSIWNAMIDRRPALIVRCLGVADVVTCVNFARERGVILSIKGGGHNIAGLAVCEGGLMLDMSRMRGVWVDPTTRTAHAQAGCLLGDVDRETQVHGLAAVLGFVSNTGIAGLTLGGGFGYLTRRFGWTSDNLLSLEMVTADGRVVRASEKENADLFWSLRGGGGNFGVVTSFTFRLHEVGTVIGGPTFWPVEQGAEILSAYREFLPSAPRELSGFFAFHTVPPGPPFPEEIHLRKVCGIVWCYVGAEQDAAAAMSPLLDAVPAPLMHGVAAMPHPMLQSAFDALYPKGEQWYWRADFINEIPDEAVAIHQRFGEAMPTMKSTMHMYPIDGAAHDVGAADTPWSYREANWSLVFAGVDPDPANAGAVRKWSIDYSEALRPYSAGGGYLNMMMDEGQERVRASYRDNYDRLARIKAQYDPENLFRVNQNIQPAA